MRARPRLGAGNCRNCISCRCSGRHRELLGAFWQRDVGKGRARHLQGWQSGAPSVGLANVSQMSRFPVPRPHSVGRYCTVSVRKCSSYEGL